MNIVNFFAVNFEQILNTIVNVLNVKVEYLFDFLEKKGLTVLCSKPFIS